MMAFYVQNIYKAFKVLLYLQPHLLIIIIIIRWTPLIFIAVKCACSLAGCMTYAVR
jgi:hypothetical protein